MLQDARVSGAKEVNCTSRQQSGGGPLQSLPPPNR